METTRKATIDELPLLHLLTSFVFSHIPVFVALLVVESDCSEAFGEEPFDEA
jgi:hypothetical protein